MRSAHRGVKQHVTIRDVAPAANFSVSTVLAAINRADYVSTEMRARMLIDHLDGRNGLQAEQSLPTALMVRESCCQPPADSRRSERPRRC